MADVHDEKTRRYNMSRIRSKNTKPEQIVGRICWHEGYRYYKNYKGLPGKPDFVFKGKARNKIIHVHGCYWHLHDCKQGQVIPKTRTEFWMAKRKRAQYLDLQREKELSDLGYRQLTVWECELKEPEKVKARILAFLAV